MGSCDLSLVDIFKEGSGPLISRLVQTLLTDPAISYQMLQVNNKCKNSSLSCKSYLLPGGVGSVSPSMLNATSRDEPDYVFQNGPAYELDFGDILEKWLGLKALVIFMARV